MYRVEGCAFAGYRGCRVIVEEMYRAFSFMNRGGLFQQLIMSFSA